MDYRVILRIRTVIKRQLLTSFCFNCVLKFAVLYEARANTGIDRMKIINAVAKSVPAPHKVDLNNPDKNIVVQIAKVR